jgi:acetyltransferase-like isoleucine patch superfamily enzyme
MLKLIALIFSRKVYIPWSWFIRQLLRFKGIKVGQGFYIEGIPYLKLNGYAKDVEIGDNVSIIGDIDIRNRERGRIIIGNNVKIDRDCRFVAANQAELKIGDGSSLGCFSVINAGDDITVGRNCLIAGFCYIQSSNHGFKLGKLIKEQAHNYSAVNVGDDVWIGGSVNILPGARIGEGVIIGANSVVLNEIPAYSIAVGSPALVKKKRV